MITPLFSIRQTATTLVLTIHAPHSRPTDIQLSADRCDFHFYTSPYLLHLRFEHPIHLPGEDDPSTLPTHTTYDLETGLAIVTLQKTPPAIHFARLDMLSTLLATRPIERAPPSIEVLSTSTTASAPSDEAQVTDTASGLQLPLRELSLGRPSYGFAARYEGVFAVRADDVSQIVELTSPDDTPVWRRRSLRKAAEDNKFCPDHYIADFLLEEQFKHVLEHQYEPPDTTRPLRDELVDAMLKLPRREYLKEADKGAAADLAGLLYAALYDERVTLGERCVESAWTVSRVCASMAFLEGFRKTREAVLAAYRRSLAYPLYRNCTLAELVLADLKMLFAVSEVDMLRARLVRVLLELREFFEDDKMLRLHCDIFLIDYCVWIQTVDDAVLARLKEEVEGICIERHELEWDLDALEAKARRIANGEEREEEPAPKMKAGQKDMDLTRSGNPAPVPDRRVTISALSPYPAPGWEMVPLATRELNPEKKIDRDAADSCSYEYEYESYES